MVQLISSVTCITVIQRRPCAKANETATLDALCKLKKKILVARM